MENSKANGIIAIIAFILGGLGFGEVERRVLRNGDQKQRQKKVDNSPVIRTPSFVAPKVSADLVSMSQKELLGKLKLSEPELREFKSFMSTASGQALQAAMAVKGTAQLLKCNIPISELYKINGNPDQLRAFVLKDGKFDQQAILSPAGLKAVAPLLVFQCLAAVTSQYYQQIITERLDEVNNKLDQLMQYLEKKDQAKLKSCYNILTELDKKRSFDVPDKARAYGCYDDLYALVLLYQDLVKAISPTKLNIKYKNTDYDEAQAKFEKLVDSHYFTYLENALFAEILLSKSNSIRWQIAAINNNEEEMNIVAKSSDFNVMEKYMNAFDSIKHDVLGYIDECLNDALIKKEEIQSLKADAEKRFRMAEQQIIQTANVLNPNITTYFRFLPDGESEVYVDL